MVAVGGVFTLTTNGSGPTREPQRPLVSGCWFLGEALSKTVKNDAKFKIYKKLKKNIIKSNNKHINKKL
jgi:hypothetical protein